MFPVGLFTHSHPVMTTFPCAADKLMYCTLSLEPRHTGALYTVYSRCSRPLDSLALLACKHTNGKHLEQELSRPTGAGNDEWTRHAPRCERLFMSSRVNYTQCRNTRHHVSTRELEEDLQEHSQAFMKACSVFYWPAFN